MWLQNAWGWGKLHLFTRSTPVKESLAADANASRRFLLPTQQINDEEGERNRGKSYGEFFDDNYDYLECQTERFFFFF